MKINSITIEGFRSFGDPQMLDFSVMKPGLYHVTGINLVQPALGVNGSGKSSLFEAVYWCFTGKTSRGLRAGTLQNWENKNDCRVVVTGSNVHGDPIAVMRQWNPNALELAVGDDEPRPVDQAELIRQLGMSEDAILCAVYFAQFPAPAFVDIRPAEQTAILSAVLDLGVWEDAAEHAAKDVNKYTDAVAQLRTKQARLEGQAQELLATNYEQKEKEWAGVKQSELRTIDAEIVTLTAKIKQQAAQVTRLYAVAQEYRKAVAAIDSKYTAPAGTLRVKIDELEAELLELRDANYDRCPTCGAKVSNDHIQREIKKKEKVLALMVANEDRLCTDADFAMSGIVKDQHSENVHFESTRDLADLNSGLAVLTSRRQTTQAQTNPFTRLRNETDERGESLVIELDDVKEDIVSLERQANGAQFWVKGFKEIRLSLINDSLTQLSVECNEAQYQLGLHDWTVSFDVERETQSKTVRRQFTMLVTAPNTKGNAVPWEAWCGGEAQRLRLSVSMGFSNLISNRCGFMPNVEFWDEPTQGLTPGGITALLEVLTERAQRQQKIILLADHRSFDYGGFAGTIFLRRDTDGSRIETY